MIIHRLRTLAFLAGLAVLSHACTDPTAPQTSLLGDIWDFTEVIQYTNGTVCSDTGSFVFVQQDSSFKGVVQVVGSCQTSTFVYPTARVDSIRGGVIGAAGITFAETYSFGVLPLCNDTAAFDAGTTDALSGHGNCTTATRTWHAVRGGPVTFLTVETQGATVVVGGTVNFEVQLRSASGARIFGRPVTWSVEKSNVATIAPTTIGTPVGVVVTAVGQGTTLVTATAGTLSDAAQVTVPAPAGLVAIGAGNAATCGLSAAGDPYCWGHIAGAFTQVPQRLNGSDTFASLAMGADFACGLTSAGAAYCWGGNFSGQLGNGGTSDTTAPRAVSGGLTFASITAGYDHACGLTSAGAAYCWGSNVSGQLGKGDTLNSAVPVAVGGGFAFTSLNAGGGHTCGLISGGVARCWGDNFLGQLGDGSTTRRLAPTLVSGGLTFTSVDAGLGHTCAVASGGAAYCWGENYGGALGNGNTTNAPAPSAVAGGLTFASVSASRIHSCGITTSGAAYCWGVNSFGQLGNGLNTGSSTPVAVTGGLTFSKISAGVYDYSDEAHNSGTTAHTCAVTTGGISYCWGDNLIGQLGIGNRIDKDTPQKVAGQP